jgi:DNA-directed RNA polymerase subunit RPC12/RpoP
MFDIDLMLKHNREVSHKYNNGDGGTESNEGVHCPYCEYFHESGPDLGQSDVYREGEHTFSCSECSKDFIVQTQIEFTWVSTAIPSHTIPNQTSSN